METDAILFHARKVLRVDVPKGCRLIGRVQGQQAKPRAVLAMLNADGEPSPRIVEPSMQGRVTRAARRMDAEGTIIVFKVSKDVAAPTRVAQIGEAADRAARRVRPSPRSHSGLLDRQSCDALLMREAVVSRQPIRTRAPSFKIYHAESSPPSGLPSRHSYPARGSAEFSPDAVHVFDILF